MRVPDVVPKSVAFLMIRKKGTEELSYAGTCFLVQYALATPGKAMQYLVTAHHVIAHALESSADGLVFIRTNVVSGGISIVTSRAREWFRHPDDSSVDVAVCPWQPQYEDGTSLKVDLVPVGVDLFATKQIMKELEVGFGDQVFCTGLFSRFVGNAKNMPIVRMGSIALVPDEPVPTRKFGNVEAFLIEVRSIGGLSGSPVFLYHMGPRLVYKAVRNDVIFKLVGLVHGHWDMPDAALTADGLFDQERLNLGIAVVVPAEKIVEVLDQPVLKNLRTQVEQHGKGQLHRGGAVRA